MPADNYHELLREIKQTLDGVDSRVHAVQADVAVLKVQQEDTKTWRDNLNKIMIGVAIAVVAGMIMAFVVRPNNSPVSAKEVPHVQNPALRGRN